MLREAVRDEVVNGRPLTASGSTVWTPRADATSSTLATRRRLMPPPGSTRFAGGRSLTVGDGKLVDGLVIAFVRDQNRVRFDISRTAASRQSLSISSRLLGLARRVDQP